eukprot:gene1332-1675_t
MASLWQQVVQQQPSAGVNSTAPPVAAKDEQENDDIDIIKLSYWTKATDTDRLYMTLLWTSVVCQIYTGERSSCSTASDKHGNTLGNKHGSDTNAAPAEPLVDQPIMDNWLELCSAPSACQQLLHMLGMAASLHPWVLNYAPQMLLCLH